MPMTKSNAFGPSCSAQFQIEFGEMMNWLSVCFIDFNKTRLPADFDGGKKSQQRGTLSLAKPSTSAAVVERME